jgi:hypothetical protein
MKRLLFVMMVMLAGAAHAQLDWRECQSNWELTADQAAYQMRLHALFRVDREPAILRFVIQPMPWGHYTPPIEAESSVALYVPEEGDAIVEFALARQSVYESKRADVPVVFKRAPMDRSLARSLTRRLHEELQARHEWDWTIVHFDSAADYTVMIRDEGATICRSADGDLAGQELDSTWAGQLAALLRRAATAPTSRAESEAALRELMALHVVVPPHRVIGPAPNETP